MRITTYSIKEPPRGRPHRATCRAGPLQWLFTLVPASAVSIVLVSFPLNVVGETAVAKAPVAVQEPSLAENLLPDGQLSLTWMDQPHKGRALSGMRKRIQAQIEYLTTTHRQELQQWFDRAEPHLPLMKFIFREEGLPEDLVYLALIESGLDLTAVSGANAVGPWQFTPSTARSYGLTTDGWIDERRDLLKSTIAAAQYLKHLYRRFGSWPLALASYNTGPTRVRQAMRDANSSDYWRLTARHGIHQETRDYVPRFIASAVIAGNRAAFGFSRQAAAPPEYDEIFVGRSTDLSLLARHTGSSYEAIRALNPELRRRETPPDRYAYRIRLPKSTRNISLASFIPLADDRRVRAVQHHLAAGSRRQALPQHEFTTGSAVLQREAIGIRRMATHPLSAIGPRQRSAKSDTILPSLLQYKKIARSHRAKTGRFEITLLQRINYSVAPPDGRSLGGRD